jgi:hypothetical protein
MELLYQLSYNGREKWRNIRGAVFTLYVNEVVFQGQLNRNNPGRQ